MYFKSGATFISTECFDVFTILVDDSTLVMFSENGFDF